MEFLSSTFSVIGWVMEFGFSFWPLVVGAPLAQPRGKKLPAMIALWVAMLGGWLVAKAAGVTPTSFLISEPLNTYIFFLAGPVLAGVLAAQAWLRRVEILAAANSARSPQDLLDVSPARFEEMVVEYYRMKGAKAWRTGATGDHGVDVVVQTPNGEKWVVQCKRWRGSVGEPTVRDFYGTVQHEKAHRGVLITTGTFTAAAREWANGKPLTLGDGEEFLKSWRRAKHDRGAGQPARGAD